MSQDGAAWTEAWRAPPAGPPGLQTRTGRFEANGRFVRLTTEGGDGAFSVSELELFDSPPAPWSSSLTHPRWAPEHPLDLLWAGLLGAVTLALVVLPRHARRWWRAVVALSLLCFLGYVLWRTWEPSGIAPARLNWIRAVVALAAFVAVLREVSFRRRFPAREGLVLGVLAVSGVLGVVCFLNFAHPQFWDAGRGKHTWLHHYDMRTYYPIARYFNELRFDGVYAASVAVVAERRGGFESLDGVGLRDLRTHASVTVATHRAHIDAVRARFSPQRWKAFTQDMGYFIAGMGEGNFLGSMTDHGGNATPVWFLGAMALFGPLDASDLTLWLGVAVDALLVLLGFAALFWAYGPRTAFLGMTVFGAMDFYMFGSNWFGAALRHDWLALWCLGLCALKKEKPFLAGALLAWAGLIRAFPFLTFVTMSAPALWALGTGLWHQRGAFDWKAFLAGQKTLLRVALGAAVVGGLLVAVSTAIFGVEAWTEWLHKVSLLNRDNHVNNIALKTYVFPDERVWRLAAAMLVGVVMFAARKLPLDEAAALGITLIGVVFNPANYYQHVVFALVVLGREKEDDSWRGAFPWLVLTAMCAASYFTSITADTTTHFYQDTLVFSVAMAALVGFELLRATPKSTETSAP